MSAAPRSYFYLFFFLFFLVSFWFLGYLLVRVYYQRPPETMVVGGGKALEMPVSWCEYNFRKIESKVRKSGFGSP